MLAARLHVNLLRSLDEGDPETQKQACRALCNMAHSPTLEQAAALFCFGVMKALVDKLRRHDDEIIVMILRAIQKILRVASYFGLERDMCADFREYALLNHLNRLQTGTNNKVRLWIHRECCEICSENRAERCSL